MFFEIMLTAIHFNDQAMLETNKIDDESSNRRLSTKAQSIQTVPSQRGPQSMLSIRHIAS